MMKYDVINGRKLSQDENKTPFQHDTDDCPTQDNSHYVVKNENWTADDDDDETF